MADSVAHTLAPTASWDDLADPQHQMVLLDINQDL